MTRQIDVSGVTQFDGFWHVRSEGAVVGRIGRGAGGNGFTFRSAHPGSGEIHAQDWNELISAIALPQDV